MQLYESGLLSSLKNFFSISGMVTLTAGLNFLFSLILFTKFGPGNNLDFYFLYLLIPQTLLSFFLAPYAGFVLPYLSSSLLVEQRKRLQSSFLIINFIFSLIITFLIVACVLLLTNFIDIPKIKTLLILCFGIPTFFIYQNLITVSHSENNFLGVEIIYFISILIPLIILYFIKQPPLFLIPCLLIARNIIAIVIYCVTNKILAPRKEDLFNLLDLVKQSLKITLAFSTAKLQPILERSILISLGSGLLSIYYLVQQIYTMITQIVNKSYTATFVPTLAAFIKNRLIKVKKIIFKTSLNSFGIFLFITLLIILSIILLLFFDYSFPKFSKEDNNLIILFMLSLILPSILALLRDYIYTSFYALKNSNIVFRIELFSFFVFGTLKACIFYFNSLYLFLFIINIEALVKYFSTIYYGIRLFNKHLIRTE